MQNPQLNKEKLSMDYTTWAIPTEVETAVVDPVWIIPEGEKSAID